MTLPCPHCRNRFALDPTLVRRPARLRCPACGGTFRLAGPGGAARNARTLTPPRPDAPEDRQPRGDGDGHDAPPAPDKTPPLPCCKEESHAPEAVPDEAGKDPAHRDTGEGSRDRTRPAWVPAAVLLLLVSLAGALYPFVDSGPEQQPRVADGRPATGGPSTAGPEPDEAFTAGHAPAPLSAPPHATRGEGTVSSADASGLIFLPRPGGEPSEPCSAVARAEAGVRGDPGHRDCDLYPPWISYLALANLGTRGPACDMETVFRTATDTLRESTLCAPGYAFLGAYYLHKRMVDRARAFLEEARQAAPNDPWVELVRALYARSVEKNPVDATQVLRDVVGARPELWAARYALVCMLVDQREYGQAREVFVPLAEAFPHRRELDRTRAALAALEAAPYYSTVMARGLLALAGAFSDLGNGAMAERICRRSLDEMPGRLPDQETKEAHYLIGRIRETRGDQEGAYTAYRSALEIDPGFRKARERINALLHDRTKSS